VSGAHKAGDAGIVETNDVTGQAAHGSFPSENAKLRACKRLLGCHAADGLSACGLREVTADLAPSRPFFLLYPEFVKTIFPKKRPQFPFRLKSEGVGRFVKLRTIRFRLRVEPLLTIRTKHNRAEGSIAPILEG
jgi:hypothetical protein